MAHPERRMSEEMFGLSDHDLMFSSESGDDQDVDDDQCPENDYIQHRVEKARELIQMESSQSATLEERLGKAPGQVGAPGVGQRGQFSKWDFPKPELQEEQQETDDSRDSDVDDAIDLTTQSPMVTARPEPIDLTTPDIKPDIKREIDLTETPRVKREPASDRSMDEYTGTTPSRNNRSRDSDVKDENHANTSIDVDFNTTHTRSPLREMNISMGEHGESPFKIPNTTPKVQGNGKRSKPSTPRTPKHDNSVVVEELIISPDSSNPIVDTKRHQRNENTFLSMSNLSSLNFKPNLNSTIFGSVDSPDIIDQSLSKISNSSTSSSPGKLGETPDNKPHTSGRFKVIVEDSPNNSNLSNNHSVKSSNHSNTNSTHSAHYESEGMEQELLEESVIIEDSLIESEDVSGGNISVNDIRSILAKSLHHSESDAVNSPVKMASESPMPLKSRRKSTAFHRRITDSFDEEEEDSINEFEVSDLHADDDEDNEEGLCNINNDSADDMEGVEQASHDADQSGSHHDQSEAYYNPTDTSMEAHGDKNGSVTREGTINGAMDDKEVLEEDIGEAGEEDDFEGSEDESEEEDDLPEHKRLMQKREDDIIYSRRAASNQLQRHEDALTSNRAGQGMGDPTGYQNDPGYQRAVHVLKYEATLASNRAGQGIGNPQEIKKNATFQVTPQIPSNDGTTQGICSVREPTPFSTQVSQEESTSGINDSLRSLQLGATGNTQMQAPTPSMDLGAPEQDFSRVSMHDLLQSGNNEGSHSNNNGRGPSSGNGQSQDTSSKHLQPSSGNQTGPGPSVTGRSTEAHLGVTPVTTGPQSGNDAAGDMQFASGDRNEGADFVDALRHRDEEKSIKGLSNVAQTEDDLEKVINFAQGLKKKEQEKNPPHSLPIHSPALKTAEPKTFEDVDGGITSIRFVDKCVHDGRLLTISKEYAHTKTKGKPMDMGGYGEVYQCGWHKKLEMEVVIKKIDYSNDEEGKRKSADNEIIAARVMHWAIAPILGMYEEQHTSTYLMLPLLENKDLFNAIKADVERIKKGDLKRMTMYTRLKILYQIASAIEYLHTEVKEFRGSVIHRDISSRNIVLDKEFNARLIDFGINVEFKQGQTSMTNTTTLGNPAYMTYTHHSRITKHNDWFCFGVVILEMLTSKDPWGDGQRKLKDEKNVGVKTILKKYRKEIKMVWNDEKVKDKLAELALKCMKTRDINGLEIVHSLENLVRTNGDNIRWSPPEMDSEKKRCVYCMVNPASDNITEHDSKCNMYVCVACLRNSYLNPIHCHTCRQQIVSPVGTKWGAILIAGNDVVTAAAGKTFTEEIEKLQEVLISKHPMVNGMSKENVCFIRPSQPGKQKDKLKRKVIEAFEKLAKKAKDQIVDTVMIYYSGHYSEKGFEFGSKEDIFTKEDFEKELFSILNIKTVYVILDCCCAPNIAIPVLGKSIIQMNATTPLEDTNVIAGIGSPFTQLFRTALIGKTFDISCKSTIQGMPHGDGKCKTCEKFFCEDGFITVERMHSFISDHLKNNTPVIYCHGADSKAMKIGYFIESLTKMKFLMQPQNVSQEAWKDKFEIPDTLDHLKCAMLLPRFLEKMVIEGGSIPVDKYSDIVAVSVKTGPKNTEINELDTMERLISAWNGKRPLYARLRDLENIRHGRVGIFMDSKIDADFILEQYLKHTDIRKFCVIKEETEMIRLEFNSDDMVYLDDALESLQLVDQPQCPHLHYLAELVDNLIKLPTLDQKDADILLEFPKVAPAFKTVHKQFFVVSLVKKQKTENEGTVTTV